MTDDYKLPNSAASLPVLPTSGKVDQLRQEPHTETTPGGIVVTGANTIELKLLQGKVIDVLSKIYDPEIPVSIYELGLIYGIDIHEDKSVKVRMTLTAPACPVAGSMPGEVEKKLEMIPEVKEAEVELVWEPAWDKSRMSEAALLQLGL